MIKRRTIGMALGMLLAVALTAGALITSIDQSGEPGKVDQSTLQSSAAS